MNAVKCNMCFDRSRKKILVEKEMVELYLDGPVRRTEGWRGHMQGEEVGSEGRNRQSPAAGHFPRVRHTRHLHVGAGLAEFEHLDKEF